METTFLKHFQFLKMKKHVFEAFFKYMEATFLNRFSILKDKKSRFSSAFEFTRNEKTSFPIVFKLTKWKNMFSKRFQTYRMKNKNAFLNCFSSLHYENHLFEAFFSFKKMKKKHAFKAFFKFTKWKHVFKAFSYLPNEKNTFLKGFSTLQNDKTRLPSVFICTKWVETAVYTINQN